MQAITAGHVHDVELLLKSREAGVNSADKVIGWRGTGLARSEEVHCSLGRGSVGGVGLLGGTVQQIAVVGEVACNDVVEFSFLIFPG